MTDSSYDNLLTHAKLPTLELSHKRAILVEVYKAVIIVILIIIVLTNSLPLLCGIYSM